MENNNRPEEITLNRLEAFIVLGAIDGALNELERLNTPLLGLVLELIEAAEILTDKLF